MNKKNEYLVLAYYRFTSILDPHQEVAEHKAFFESRDVSARIYLSEQGINGQMSAIEQDAHAYMDWLNQRTPFQGITFKIHRYHEHVFPRLTVKYRKQLVAMDEKFDLSERGEYLSPQEWKEALERSNRPLLLDVRNDYEWKLGRFSGAELPPCETFREFTHYADQLKEKIDPKKHPIMMYCTGGIRCEIFSAVLKKNGFEKVYQLEGGILNYGLQQGTAHWLGKVFVFDDRLSIPIAEEEESEVIGTCHRCGKPNDTYYNCANMDCNALFLSCSNCLKQFSGCCQEDCMKAERLRPYHQQNPHKPFRRWYHYPGIKKDNRD